MERRFACVRISGKYHTDYPEENNVISGDKHVCRIKIIQIFRLFRPSQYGKRPQRGRKPRIKRILVLGHMGVSALRASIRHCPRYDHLAALVAVIRRNPVPPPNLPGDAPVTDIFKPVQVNLVKSLRHELKLACLHRLNRRLCQLLHPDKPLLFYQRLYRGVATVMGSYVVAVGNHFHQKPLFLKLLHHQLARRVAVHPRILPAVFIDGGIIVHHIDLRQIVAFPHLKVIGVMCRRNLNRARSKFLINVRIRNNRYLFSH